MVTINVPALHKGISFGKDEEITNPKRYVSVYEHHAIIVSGHGIIILDLNDYFLNYQKVQEEDSFIEFLNWLDGKHFTPEIWAQMVGLKKIKVMDENSIQIEHESYKNVLTYEPQNVYIDAVLKLIRNNANVGAVSFEKVGFPQRSLAFIDKTIGGVVGGRVMVWEFPSQDKPIRFSYNDMPCVFGFIANKTKEIEEKLFDFSAMEEFTKRIKVE